LSGGCISGGCISGTRVHSLQQKWFIVKLILKIIFLLLVLLVH
jgi:hypothetical protein